MYFSEPAVNPFAGLRDQEAPQSPGTEQGRAFNARLAAFAGLNVSAEAEGILRSMEERTQTYLAQIEGVGEHNLRMEAATRRKEQQASELGSLLREAIPTQDEELIQGSLLAYENVLRADAEEDARYALERQAVENIQNLAANGNQTQARILLSNLENGGALDVIADYNSKQLILQNMIDRVQGEVDAQPWIESAANFVLGLLVPDAAMSNTGNVPVREGLERWFDAIWSGQRLEREADSLWDMPIEEFSRFVNEDFIRNLHENSTLLGYTNNNEKLNLITQLAVQTPDTAVTNTFNSLDVAGLLPVGGLTRIGRSIPGLLVRNGARREAAELAAKAALDITNDSVGGATAKTGVTLEQTIDALSPSAINSGQKISRVSIATTANEALDRARLLADELLDLQRTNRLTPEELQRAQDVVTERFERQFGREIKDVEINDVDLVGGSSIKRVAFSLGRRNGDGFSTEAMANRYLTSISERGRAIQDESGQWFARLEIDMPETGFYRNLNVQNGSPARFVLNARNIGDIELADAAQVAGNKRNKILIGGLVKEFQDTFRSLGRQRDDLAAVLHAGDAQGRWFNREELGTIYQRTFNRQPSEREIEAYNVARDINDIEYLLRNEDIYRQKVVRGFRSVSFDVGGNQRVDRANAIIDRELKAPPNTRFYDLTSGRHYVDGLDDAAWARVSKGKILVTLEEPFNMPDGTIIKQFLVRDKDAVVDNLRLDQVPYRPGGHRMYQGKYFVKQAVQGAQPDTLRKFWKNPNTYIVAETRAEADFWAKRMEAARQAYLRGDGLDVIDEIFEGKAGFPTPEEFVRGVEDGTFSKDFSFGTYADRELPVEYSKAGSDLDFVDMEEGGFNGYLRTNGRMYTGRKGAQLRDYKGDLAPLLDPYETLNRSLGNIASLSSFGDYKIQAIERWMSTFGPYLDLSAADLRDASNMRRFIDAPLISGGNLVDQQIINKAEAQRTIIKRTLNWKSPRDLAGEQIEMRLMDYVAGDRVGGALPEARKAVANWWLDKNPITSLRSFAFDLKLGLFNIAQLPLQLSTAVAATTMSPTRGLQGWAMIAPMKWAFGSRSLGKQAFEDRLSELVKRGVHDIGGFENANEFKSFVRSAFRSGFFDVGGTHSLIDDVGPSAAMDGFSSGLARFREAGRFFFFESERMNRMVAWRIAWDEVRKSNPGLKIDSPEFAQKLAGRAEEFSFNMSRESQAWWQKGLLSIPTQFWAYNARMLEAMTVGNFTAAQKARLILGQTFLYGSAGLPVSAAFSQFMKSREGEGTTPDNLVGILDRGFVDTAIYQMTGGDVNVLVGGRVGTGGWLPGLVADIFGQSQYGPTSVADVLGGATYSIFGQAIGGVLKAASEWQKAESGDESSPLQRSALLRVAANVSTIGNTLKALMVYNYGTYQTNSGATMVSDLPPATAFAVALSLQPAEMDSISAMMNYRKNRNKVIQEAARVITNYRIDMLNRPDQRETLAEDVNTFVRLLPEDVRAEALRRAQTSVDPSLYDGLVKYMQEEEARYGTTD